VGIERATLPEARTITLAEALRERARVLKRQREEREQEEKRRGSSCAEDGADSLPGHADRG
jgi:hypothetical protein